MLGQLGITEENFVLPTQSVVVNFTKPEFLRITKEHFWRHMIAKQTRRSTCYLVCTTNLPLTTPKRRNETRCFSFLQQKQGGRGSDGSDDSTL